MLCCQHPGLFALAWWVRSRAWPWVGGFVPIAPSPAAPASPSSSHDCGTVVLSSRKVNDNVGFALSAS